MHLFKAKVKKVIIEAEDVKSYCLALEEPFNFKPGQYVGVILDVKDDPRGPVRPFSIASSPTEKDLLIVATKMTNSPYKKKMDSLKEGGEVSIRGPFGRFVMEEDYSKPVVMLAGGIGITPLRSMIKYSSDKKLPLKIILLYSNKTAEGIAFKEELDNLAKINKNIKVVYTITRTDESKDESKQKWAGRIGRIDENMIKENVHGINDINNCIFYIVGPGSMVDDMLNKLNNMKVPKENIRFEVFTGY